MDVYTALTHRSGESIFLGRTGHPEMAQSNSKRSSSKDLIARLEALNRGKLAHTVKIAADIPQPPLKQQSLSAPFIEISEKPVSVEEPQPILYRRDLPNVAPVIRSRPVLSERFVALEEVMKGVEYEIGDFGKAYLIESCPCDEVKKITDLASRFALSLDNSESNIRKRLAAARKIRMQEIDPREIIIMDIESTGLGCCPLFLIGTLEYENDSLICRQYLARNYAEESAVIARFIEVSSPKKLLVTFNGKSFDIPFRRTRAAANGVAYTLESIRHLDMLHESRRIWKGVFPDCRLQTLEMHVCGRARYGDIPGSEIPDAYHAFVRTSNAVELADIITHNMLDLVTLAELMVKMPAERK